MALTKTDKRKRVRAIRAKLARFNDLQDADMQEYLRDRGRDPAYTAMNALLFAYKELADLIDQLRAEGYGEEHRGL